MLTVQPFPATKGHIMRFLPFLATVAVLAVAAPPASAEPADTTPSTAQPIATRTITDSLVVAAKFWGARPDCSAGVRVYVAALDAVKSTDGNLTAAAAAGDCAMWLDPRLLANSLDRPWDYNGRIKRCNAIVHEFGHLIHGPGHSTNPLSILAPETNIEVDVMGCYKRFKPRLVTRAQDREAFDTRRLWAVR